MAAISGQSEPARRFAKALGLDPDKVKKIVLRIDVDDVITAEVTLLPDKEEMELLNMEINRYILWDTETDE